MHLQNALPYEDYANASSYILGIGDFRGRVLDKVLLYAPAGGNISNLTIGGTAQADAPLTGTLNKHSITHTVLNIAYGQNATLDFDVTTSPKTKEDLKLDQSPMGWAETGVDYEKPSCEPRK